MRFRLRLPRISLFIFELEGEKATLRGLKCSCGKWNNIHTLIVMIHLDNDAPKMEVFFACVFVA